MKIREILIICALSMCIVLPMAPLSGEEISTGFTMDPLAFSSDRSKLVIESYDHVEGIGGWPFGRLLIVDLEMKEIIERIPISYSEHVGKYEGTDSDKMEKINKGLKERAMRRLEKNGYQFLFEGYENKSEMDNSFRFKSIQVGYQDRKTGDFQYRFNFYMKDLKSGFTVNIASREHPQHDKGMVRIKEVIISPDGKKMIIIYRTPPMMEFEPGEDGVIIINSLDLAGFYNGIGLSYHKKKMYHEALARFRKALHINGGFYRAAYNIACVHALQGNEKESVDQLKMIIKMKVPGIKSKIRKRIVKDSDFNRIRKGKHFQDFLAGL